MFMESLIPSPVRTPRACRNTPNGTAAMSEEAMMAFKTALERQP
jgi:hypothetical protein